GELDRQGIQETLRLDALARGGAGTLLRPGRGLLRSERELRHRSLPPALRRRLSVHGPDVARPGLLRTTALWHRFRRDASRRDRRPEFLTRGLAQGPPGQKSWGGSVARLGIPALRQIGPAAFPTTRCSFPTQKQNSCSG